MVGEQIEPITNYDLLAPQITDEKRTPFCASATRARKVCKASLQYQGWQGEKAILAAFTAEERIFDLLSAGNPNKANWTLMDDSPTAWRESVEKTGRLPKEQITG